MQTDSNSLYFHRARYYHAVLRRFLNQDTVIGSPSAPSSINRFAYANGQPVSAIDPLGLEVGFHWDESGRMTGPYDSGPPLIPMPKSIFVFVDIQTREEKAAGPGTGIIMVSGNFYLDQYPDTSILATSKLLSATVPGAQEKWSADGGAQWTGSALDFPGEVNPAVQAGVASAGGFATDNEISIYGGVPVGKYLSFGIGFSWDNPWKINIDNWGLKMVEIMNRKISQPNNGCP